jgi:hypothetical protein
MCDALKSNREIFGKIYRQEKSTEILVFLFVDKKGNSKQK